MNLLLKRLKKMFFKNNSVVTKANRKFVIIYNVFNKNPRHYQEIILLCKTTLRICGLGVVYILKFNALSSFFAALFAIPKRDASVEIIVNPKYLKSSTYWRSLPSNCMACLSSLFVIMNTVFITLTTSPVNFDV